MIKDSVPEYDIVMFGHLARDCIVVDGQAEDAAGGGVYFGSVVLKRLGLDVAVVTRLHPKDFALVEELEEEGVDVFAQPAPQTSGIANYYSSTDMERRICKPLGFAGPIELASVPKVSAKIYAITPIIAGEVDKTLLEVLAKRGPVALDVQGFVRVPQGESLVFQPWRDMKSCLALVRYLKVDRSEAELLTGDADLHRAARELSEFGPREIVLTQSSGVTVWAEGKIYEAPFNSRSLGGRTGRGDTCFATYLGARLSMDAARACRLAAAVTSLKQEKPGPWRGSLAQAQARADSLVP